MMFSHLLASLALAASVCAVLVSPPLGIHGVASTNMALLDKSRTDPYSTPKQHRRLMVSAFFPMGSPDKCQRRETAYMPPLTAASHDETYAAFGLPNGTFERLELSFCQPKAERTTKSVHYPIVLFSPGLGNSRLLYTAVAQSLASNGFIVITIDHPSDATIVEFPDGSSVLAADISSDEQITQAVSIRADDMRYVIDQLQKTTFRKTLLGSPHAATLFDARKGVIAIGHSLGGATALSAMIRDPRITSAINFDGSILGDALTKESHCPTLLVSHEGKNLSTDDSWSQSWPLLEGSKALATVRGSEHGSFTDLPLLASTLGLGSGPGVDAVLGTIGSGRIIEIMNALVKDLSSFVNDRATSSIVSKGASKFSELSVLEEKLNGRCNGKDLPNVTQCSK